MEFIRKTLPEQHYHYVDRECAYGPEIAEVMGSGFGDVFGFVGASGITPTSMPMSLYFEMDPSVLRFRAAVMVSAEDAAKASGPIKTDMLAAGDVMMALHKGTYDAMQQTHKAMWDHMGTKGIPGTMPIWEVYVDNPGDTAPEDFRTEIYCTIR